MEGLNVGENGIEGDTIMSTDLEERKRRDFFSHDFLNGEIKDIDVKHERKDELKKKKVEYLFFSKSFIYKNF